MRFYTRKRRTPAVIIVSLIDIFVILLIFVIVTSTFKRAEPAVTLKLPESSQAAPAKDGENERALLLTIAKGGEVFLDERPAPLESLVAALRAAGVETRPIALRADTDAPFGVVIRVMDSLKEAGVKGSLPAFTEIRKGN